MNKVLAELLAAPIPNKMTRNQWRGRLRYGLWNAFCLKREILTHESCFPHDLAVCAIVKNEGPYLVEWIEWHRRAEVERFYIYDNGSSDGTREILQPYIDMGLLEYTYWPGKRQQLAAYDDCLQRHRYDVRWIAFIDIDEFIINLQHMRLPDFLLLHDDAAALEINWLVYGSSGAKTREEGDVMKRFRRHSQPSHPLNRKVKSIVNTRRACCMIGCHEAARIEGCAIDSHGQPVTRHFSQREPQHDVIRINHYAVRSYEEFLEKQQRGRASGRQRTVPDKYFKQYDLNDVEDEDSERR